ncbi:MAG: ABC transporter C-terminal domain-containing protein, partial [Pseudomonadota bacterium]
EGDLGDYRELILAASRGDADRKPKAAAPAAPRRTAAQKREALAPLRQKMTDAETRIEALKRDLQKVDQLLAKPGLFETDFDRGVKLSKLRADLEEALDAAEMRWLEASEAYEQAAAAQRVEPA